MTVTVNSEKSDGQVTGDHLRAGEFRALSHYLLNSIKEVTFGSNLTPCAYCKHARLLRRELTTGFL